jgi:glycosyltransferase involved in cell wall biosynthesis
MRIVYFADAQIPGRATNGIQVMRMCGAFAAAGVDVTLVHPFRFGNLPEGFDGDVWRFYGVESTFRRITLPTPLTLRLSGHRALARTLRLPPLAAYVFARSTPLSSPFIAYGRSMLGLRLADAARRVWPRSACRRVVAELHDLPQGKAATDILSRLDGAVITSAELDRELVKKCPTLRGRTHVDQNGFKPLRIGSDDLAGPAETIVDSTPGRPLVVYTGRVTTGKGARLLVEVAAKVPQAQFLLVGKVYECDILELGRRAGNVTFTGFVPPSAVRSYLTAADVLVMPTHSSLSYARYSSPLKLFEYMAAGKPMICADLPAVREVVSDGRNGVLFTAGNAVSLSDAVIRLLQDPALAMRIADQAQRDVERFTWNARAVRIIEWLSTPT